MKKAQKKTQDKKVTRPWGGYEIIEKNNTYWIKKLYVSKDKRTSLQSHKQREEVWTVLRGTVKATHGKDGKKRAVLSVGDMIRVPQGEVHRLYGVTNAVVLETAFGRPLEGDITRYEDDYGRAA